MNDSQRADYGFVFGLFIICVFFWGTVFSCFNEKKQSQVLPPVPTGTITLPDSTTAISQQVITDPDALTSVRKEAKQLGITPKSIVLSQQTATMTEVVIPVRNDTIAINDTVYIGKKVEHHDDWSDVSLNDTTVSVSFRDSLSVFVSRIYRHRFLFWKWGTKGYNVTIHNHNPHSRITYNKTIYDGK